MDSRVGRILESTCRECLFLSPPITLMTEPDNSPPVPKTFWQYVRSMGPGIIIVLT